MCYLCSFFVLGCSACQKNQRFSWLTGIRPIIDKENSFLPASSHKLFSLSMALLIAYAHYIMKQSFMIVIYTRFARQSLLYHKSNYINCNPHTGCKKRQHSRHIWKQLKRLLLPKAHHCQYHSDQCYQHRGHSCTSKVHASISAMMK